MSVCSYPSHVCNALPFCKAQITIQPDHRSARGSEAEQLWTVDAPQGVKEDDDVRNCGLSAGVGREATLG